MDSGSVPPSTGQAEDSGERADSPALAGARLRFYPADMEGVATPQPVEWLDGGAVRSLPGNRGCVLWGPRASVEAGVYRLTARTRAVGGAPDALYWDVYADNRVYATAEFNQASRRIARLPDTTELEFRFTTQGVEFVHEGVEVEALLLDREAAGAEQIEALIDSLPPQEIEAEALFHLIERLAATGAVEAAERRRAAYVAGRGRPYAKLRATLIALNTPDLTLQPPEFEFDLSHEEITAAVGLLPLTRLNLFGRSTETWRARDREELLRRGYQPDFLQATRLHRSLREPRRPWQMGSLPGSPVDPAPRPPMTEALSTIDLSFQAALARGEGLSAYCPVSGRLLTSTHGFCHHFFGLPQTLYRFEGVEVFYVCTGGYSNSRLFMYMPRMGTIVPLEEPELQWYSYEDLVREFNANFVFYRHEVIDYLKAPTRPAAVLGLNNIGHYFWNDLSGLQYAIDHGLTESLAEVVTVPIQYADYLAFFPELAAKPTTQISNPRQTFGHFVRNGLLPVRFTDAVISPEYFQRVRRAAAERASPAGLPPPNAPRPLLWLNLRANNKVWVDQAAGYANILNAIREEYGQASALLQGMPDCAELFAEVRRLAHPEVQLLDGLDLGIYDKLSFAGQVDAYICVAGAGLAFTTWLADVPGVAHGEHGHMKHLDWWVYARPKAARPLAPPLSAITDLGTGWYCDYEVDWRILLDLLRQALAGYRARLASGPSV